MLIKRSLIALLLALILSACGQKGPLRLNQAESSTDRSKSNQAQTDQASSSNKQQTDDSQEQQKQTPFKKAPEI